MTDYEVDDGHHLIVPSLAGGVGDAGTEPLGELPHQVVIYPVLHRTQDDHRPANRK